MQTDSTLWLGLLAIVITVSIAIFIFRSLKKNLEGDAEQLKKEALKEAEAAKDLQVTLKKDLESLPETKPIPEKKSASTPALTTLDSALYATRKSLFGRIQNLFEQKPFLTEADLENVEEILYTSDIGPRAVQRLLTAVTQNLPRKDARLEDLTALLKKEMSQTLEQVQSTSTPTEFLKSFQEKIDLKKSAQGGLGTEPQSQSAKPIGPQVWLVVGVNGVGKTTTLGKLSALLSQSGHKVLVAAGDTFRAAAQEQLKVWSDRASVEIYAGAPNAAPSGVAFDACQKAVSEKFDIVLIDTAGRLHTQANLMDELKKIRRVIEKVIPTAPHEVILVLDANSGQNALIQAKQFHEAVQVTGVVLTKMDGTAKGGIALGLATDVGLPIRFIGVGEKLEDLRPFSTQDFIHAIFA